MRIPLVLGVIALFLTPGAVGTAPPRPDAAILVHEEMGLNVFAWTAVKEADAYRVYRGADEANLVPIAIVFEPYFMEPDTPDGIYGVSALSGVLESARRVVSETGEGGDCVYSRGLSVSVSTNKCVQK